METLTSNSSRAWLDKHPLKIERYVRRHHKVQDRAFVLDLIYNQYPDEGMRLIENFDLTNDEKILLVCRWIIESEQLTGVIFGDQRMGKDVTICFFIMRCLELLRYYFIRPVTLGNIKKPPFVNKKDMYFGYDNIPPMKGHDFIIVYCSELEVQYPSREGGSTENKSFSILEGTMAQNHHKLLGAVKLAAKVDLNVLRSCNLKFFKFMSPDKLNVEGIERDGVLSGLGSLLLPADRNNKSEVLVAFDNYLLKINVPLPDWWSQEYSEMFSDISMSKIDEYIDWAFSNDYKIPQIVLAVKQKFRKQITKQYVAERVEAEYSVSKIKI
jgi:hypothetical protein